MKPYWTLNNLIIIMLLLGTSSITNADEFSGHIGGVIGIKTMNSSDWPDLDKHFSIGIIFDFKKESWPISIALDTMDTGDKHKHAGMEDLGHSTEHHLGIRKIFNNQHSKIQPYFGGGVSFIYAEQEIEANNITTTQDDRDVGAWLGGGMYYEINAEFLLGVDMRYSNGKVTLFNKKRDAGGIFFGITASYQF